MPGTEMIRTLSAKNSRAKNSGTTAKANVAVNLAPLGRISAGAEVPGEHLCALARVTVWIAGTVLSAFIPAITFHVSMGLLTPAESLVVVGVQFLLTICFTIQAARPTGRLGSPGNAE